MIVVRGASSPRPDSPWTAIAALFPASVVFAATDGADAIAPLFPDEAPAVANAVEKRRREFALGRQCARAALAELGYDATSIPSRDDRAPRWPDGIVGSITHCRGFVGAVVAHTTDVDALGFDAEPATPLEAAILPSVCRREEIDWIRQASAPPAANWAKVIFSAKETIHKYIAPSSGVMLDFTDVIVTLDPASATFTAVLADAAEWPGVDLSPLAGRFAFHQGFVFTAATSERAKYKPL